MTGRWLILADDLTGAADAGAPFAHRGPLTEIIWQETLPADDAAVVACDVDSRRLSPASAAERHRAALQRLLTPERSLFKKIDSTLRGQPAAEVAASCAVLRQMGRPAFGICAPANPAMGRTTRDGRVLVDDKPLEHTDLWRLEHSYPRADLAEIFASAGLGVVKIPLAKVRGDPAELRRALRAAAEIAVLGAGGLAVCDSQTEEDLARIVAAAKELPEAGFYIGTAGLAQALAATLQESYPREATLQADPRGTLVVVGTAATVSRAAALRLATHEGITTLRIDPNAAVDGPSRNLFAMRIGARLMRGDTTIAMLEAAAPATGVLEPAYVRLLAETLSFALRQAGAIIVTGGETASSLLAQAHVGSIRLLDEIEPGMALGVTCGDIEVPIVTKPGAFGDEESLIRCLERLRRLRPSP